MYTENERDTKQATSHTPRPALGPFTHSSKTRYKNILFFKMKSYFVILFLALVSVTTTTWGFTPISKTQSLSYSLSSSSSTSTSTTTRLNFFGTPKDDGTPGDYVCKDCGYVFTKGPKAWAALKEDDYRCPPCGAPKFRFKKVPKGSAKGKVEVKKSWF